MNAASQVMTALDEDAWDDLLSFIEERRDPAHQAALLKEAAALLEAAAPTLKPLREIQEWRERIRQAQTAHAPIIHS